MGKAARVRRLVSAKAGRMADAIQTSPEKRKRQKTAYGAVKKDTMLMQTDAGPRVLWGRTKPKVKKG